MLPFLFKKKKENIKITYTKYKISFHLLIAVKCFLFFLRGKDIACLIKQN